MFKSSENLRLAAEMRALERVARPWREARRTWFDGTPQSIEARLAATDRVLSYARGGMTQAHVALEREASLARAELREAAHRLMVDFLDDGARAFKGSKRVAGKHDADPEHPWRNTIHEDKYWSQLPTPDFADLYTEDGEPVGKHRAEAAKERGLRECINCGGGLSGEEDDDKESECPNCGMSAHHKGVDWRKKGSYRTADEHTGFGDLGPGYDHFGDDDYAEYDDYLRRHDYHTDPRALEHRLRLETDDDDPAHYSSRRTAGDGPGTIDDHMLRSMGLDPRGLPLGGGYGGSNSPYGDDDHGGSSEAYCKHCGDEIVLEHPEGDWVHPDEWKDGYEGGYPVDGPHRDHSAEPEDDDVHTASYRTADNESFQDAPKPGGGKPSGSMLNPFLPGGGDLASTGKGGQNPLMSLNPFLSPGGGAMTGQEDTPAFNPGPKAPGAGLFGGGAADTGGGVPIDGGRANLSITGDPASDLAPWNGNATSFGQTAPSGANSYAQGETPGPKTGMLADFDDELMF